LKDGLENIDEVFKQAFDGFESNVDPSVWNNIQSSITSGSSGANSTPQMDPSVVSGVTGKSLALKFVAGVVLLGSVATATYVALTTNKENVVTENIVSNGTVSVSVEEKIIPVVTEPMVKESIKEVQVEVTEAEVDELTKEETVEEVQNEVVEGVVEESNAEVVETTVEEPNAKVNEATVEESNAEIIEEPVVEKAIDEPYVTESIDELVDFNKLIPNVITPNGDGKNDGLIIPMENIEKLEVVIMDKTGKIVHIIRSADDTWNGKDLNGYDLLPGVYYMSGVIIDKAGNKNNIKKIINLYK
jgi:gliding motility-associated-like protein